MASESVHPLRIAKNAPSTGSPTKMASGIPRPLTDLSPTSQRRNSPSWKQNAKKMSSLNTDSSPFQSSPLETTTSPKLFWQNRSNHNTENGLYGGGRSGSPSPVRRSSIEKLQKASRVKNSNILALEQKQEYDPTRLPQVERPLSKVQGNAYNGTGATGLRSEAPRRGLGHHRNESQTHIPLYSPTKSSIPTALKSTAPPKTPTKEPLSPMKSSLSNTKFKGSFDPETGVWSDDQDAELHELPTGRSLHRHAKSVTFDAAPPQVNEYEMATPDLSSVGSNSREGSFDSVEDDDDYDGHYIRGDADGQDDSFDASLEDTDKTPVVGPDDWRQDSEGPNDAFEGSPMPEAAPGQAARGRPQHGRSDSSTSSGEHRPLPPLPGASLQRSESTASLSATAERMLGSHRSLPSPPPASASKLEIQNIGGGALSLDERLKLMMLSDDSSAKAAAAEQRERRMRRAGAKDRFTSPTPEPVEAPKTAEEEAEEDDTIGDISGLDEYQLPPRISRESILRRVNGNKALDRESDYHFSSPAPSSSPERRLPYDPDIPIPSTEDSILDDDDEGSVIIRRDVTEDLKDEVYDLYRDDSKELDDDTDTPSRYSDDDESDEHDEHVPLSKSLTQESEAEVTTPRAATPVDEKSLDAVANLSQALSPVAKSTKEDNFRDSFEQFMLPKSGVEAKGKEVEGPKMADAHAFLQRPYTPDQPLSKPEYDGTGWGDDDEFEPGTPDSVIHHPLVDDEIARDSPTIPEQLATIKSASGSKLKTRPSATPADLLAMREARRQVSHEIPVPPIPERHKNRISRDMEAELEGEVTSDDFLARHPSFKKRSLTLDLDLGLSLDEDIERVIEAQKVAFNQFTSDLPPSYVDREPAGQASRRTVPATLQAEMESQNANIEPRRQRGYLMRQNTKLVTASDKESDELWKTRSAGNSPVKADRPQSWTVEPWNGKTRPKSMRKRGGLSVGGPVPPLPGQESNAMALNSLAEEDLHVDLATDESGERGRLFVKVMGVKDLDLPLPKNERTWFSLTLDNGVHCVTTAWLELARNAPIGQEFELVVPTDLEFQLTLNVKLERPPPQMVPQSFTKPSKPKTSTFSRVFASPKKRKEMEMRQREEEERFAQQQREAHARQMNAAPTAWDLLSPLAAEDGSFARSYVCLKEHENRCFGRPYMVEVACFNEWATEEAGFASSVKSKRGDTTVVRRAPYKIGKLELQLLFVPRPKGSTDEDMPKSMNSCIRELKAAEERLSRNWEGHLSQQGGDCPYWRRRYFKLVGTKLTAYHEATRQPRATINLANAKRLIDDRRTLTEKETTGKGGKRRRSAFAEEEEGYMFVEEGFRIRFNNGELIDFYADTAEDKDGWMKVLSDVVGRGAEGGDDDSISSGGPRSRSKWCELVLKREDTLRRRAEGRRVHSRTKSMYV